MYGVGSSRSLASSSARCNHSVEEVFNSYATQKNKGVKIARWFQVLHRPWPDGEHTGQHQPYHRVKTGDGRLLTIGHSLEIRPVVTKPAVTKMRINGRKQTSTWNNQVRKAVPVREGNGTDKL